MQVFRQSLSHRSLPLGKDEDGDVIQIAPNTLFLFYFILYIFNSNNANRNGSYVHCKCIFLFTSSSYYFFFFIYAVHSVLCTYQYYVTLLSAEGTSQRTAFAV